ncbi:helix-turn-helix domain-containing protein [Streptococcus ferus]|uniref:helix-turn-helix domain-containing protein n=1 Tax=Streptococcus ferus TaxID=1345 RepID=UPI0035A076B1
MFPQRLKSLRLEAGLTQKEIAEKFKIKQPNYQQWESGKRKPSSDTLEKFATFFNVSTDYLLGNTDIKNPNTEIDKEDLKESLRHSLGYTGEPPTEEEVENMANAFLEYMAKRNSN